MKTKQKAVPIDDFIAISGENKDIFIQSNKNKIVFFYKNKYFVLSSFVEKKYDINKIKHKITNIEINIDDDFALWWKESGIKFFYRKGEYDSNSNILYAYVEKPDITGSFSIRDKGNFLDFQIPYKPKYVNQLLTFLPVKQYKIGGVIEDNKVFLDFKKDTSSYFDLENLNIKTTTNIFIDNPIKYKIDINKKIHHPKKLGANIYDWYGNNGIMVLSSVATYLSDLINNNLTFNPPIFLVGSTGTGKSTLARLMMYLLSPQEKHNLSIQSWDSSFASLRNYMTGTGIRAIDEYKPPHKKDNYVNKLLDAIIQGGTISHAYKSFKINTKVIFTTNYESIPTKDIAKMLVVYLPKITQRADIYEIIPYEDIFNYGLYLLHYIYKNNKKFLNLFNFKPEIKYSVGLDVRMEKHLKQMAIFMTLFKNEPLKNEYFNYYLKELIDNLFLNIEKEAPENNPLSILMKAMREVLLNDYIKNKDRYLPVIYSPNMSETYLRYVFPQGTLRDLRHISKSKISMSAILQQQIPYVKAGRIDGRYYIDFLTDISVYPSEFQDLIAEYIERADEINDITYNKKIYEMT